jgi:hypothetical protein
VGADRRSLPWHAHRCVSAPGPLTASG